MHALKTILQAACLSCTNPHSPAIANASIAALFIQASGTVHRISGTHHIRSFSSFFSASYAATSPQGSHLLSSRLILLPSGLKFSTTAKKPTFSFKSSKGSKHSGKAYELPALGEPPMKPLTPSKPAVPNSLRPPPRDGYELGEPKTGFIGLFSHIPSLSAQKIASILFKTSICVITVPTVVYALIKMHIIEGSITLMDVNNDPHSITLGLARARFYIQANWLVKYFDDHNGVMMTMRLFSGAMRDDVLNDAIETLKQIAGFPHGLDALVAYGMASRIERAYAEGWIPSHLLQSVDELYEIVEVRRQEMRATFLNTQTEAITSAQAQPLPQ